MSAKIVPIAPLLNRVSTLWDRGLPPGFSTGWKTLDPHYTVAPGQLTVVTGWPGSGKSEWLDGLLVNLSRDDWKFAGLAQRDGDPQGGVGLVTVGVGDQAGIAFRDA